jgi:S1-C subfamily serine protease
MKAIRFAIAAAALAMAPGLAPRVLAEEFDATALYDKCVRSTVFINTPLKGGSAQGSGSLIDAERRYVLTNYHVVDEVDQVFVQFPVRNKDGSLMTDKKKYIERIPAGQALKGKVLFRDKTRDLAIVQLDRLPPDTHALPLAKKSAKTGEPVINIGNPGVVDWTFSTTQGTVRGIGLADWAVGGHGEVLRIKCYMVTVTNPINGGDSGGPLIDRRGYQVGVTESSRNGAQNVNNCVDIREVWGFLDEKKITIKDLTADDGPVPHRKDPEVKKKNGPGPLVPDPPPEKKTDPADPAPGAPTAKVEQDADMALRRAKLFKDETDSYKDRLKNVIDKYPGTRAAAEAKKLLEGLK